MQVEFARVAEAPCNGIPSLWIEDEEQDRAESGSHERRHDAGTG